MAGRQEDVVVIGGGAVGVCCAYELARAGRQVRLVERNALCAGSSYGNAGLVPLSACLPLAGPGVIRKALVWLREPSGPFRLQLPPNPALAAWLWRFRSFCTAEAAMFSARLLCDLTRASLRLFEELASTDGLDFGFRRSGLLTLFRTEVGREETLAEVDALRALEIASRLLDRAGVAELVPRATASVLGGVYFPEDAHLDPARLVHGLARLLERAGASVETGAEVLRLRVEDGVVAGVETTRGQLAPELLVLANGAWSPGTVRGLGLPLPIQPGKGYSLTLRQEESTLELPVRLAEAKTTVTPMSGRLRVASKLDLVGFDLAVDRRRVEGLSGTVREYLRFGERLGPLETWCGLRPLTPDGLPIIGRHPGATNLILATGHGHLGVTLAPITGRLVAELAAGKTPSFDLEPFRAERFRRFAKRRGGQRRPRWMWPGSALPGDYGARLSARRLTPGVGADVGSARRRPRRDRETQAPPDPLAPSLTATRTPGSSPARKGASR